MSLRNFQPAEKKGKAQKIQMVTISAPLGTSFSGKRTLRTSQAAENQTLGERYRGTREKPFIFSCRNQEYIWSIYGVYWGVWGILEHMESMIDQDNLASCDADTKIRGSVFFPKLIAYQALVMKSFK